MRPSSRALPLLEPEASAWVLWMWESLPLEKGAGDGVFAGALNLSGTIDVRVSRRAHETTLAKILILGAEICQQTAPE